MNQVLIELHVDNFEKVKGYYQALGFKSVWERKPEGPKGYLVMELEGNVLCFWSGNNEIYNQPHFQQFPKNTTRGYGVEISINVSDIESYYDKYKHIANVVEPLILQPWGLKDFRAVDPFGYYLRFTSKHDITNSKFAVE